MELGARKSAANPDVIRSGPLWTLQEQIWTPAIYQDIITATETRTTRTEESTHVSEQDR